MLDADSAAFPADHTAHTAVVEIQPAADTLAVVDTLAGMDTPLVADTPVAEDSRPAVDTADTPVAEDTADMVAHLTVDTGRHSMDTSRPRLSLSTFSSLVTFTPTTMSFTMDSPCRGIQ
jgi:hypothetical protein